MTIQAARAWAREQLAGHSDAAVLDADWLLLHVLGQGDVSFLVHAHDTHLRQPQEDDFLRAIQKRVSGMPLAYIIGEAHFYGRAFRVTPDVLIPRPATEELVTQAKVAIKSLARLAGRPITVADIGTGSGCVAITLLLECVNEIEQMFATDISPAALTIAADNAKRHGADGRITFLQGNMLEPLQAHHIDLLVSNPPYVPSPELERPPTTDTAGLAFEPRVALDGGPDGLMYVRQLQQSGIPAIIETLQGNII